MTKIKLLTDGCYGTAYNAAIGHIVEATESITPREAIIGYNVPTSELKRVGCVLEEECDSLYWSLNAHSSDGPECEVVE